MKRIFKLIEKNKLEVSILENTNPSPEVKIPFVALVKNKAGPNIRPFWLWQKRPTKRPLKICAENYHVISLDRTAEEALLKMGINPRHLYWIGSFSLQNNALLLKYWSIAKITKIGPKIQSSCSIKSYYPEYVPLDDFFIRIKNEKCSLVKLENKKIIEVVSVKKMAYLQAILSDNNRF